MNIDINTRFVTLIGTPLSQSFAARMQNHAYELMGENMCYFYTEQDGTHLGEIVNALRHMPFAGFAVTKPNKVAVMQYLDEVSPLCAQMGSCNTVVIQPDGRLKGYNTDGYGFFVSITEAGVDIANERFFVIGSGGAGRAIASTLAFYHAAMIYVTDVVEESGRALVEDLRREFGGNAEFVYDGDYSVLPECSVVINASGVGMGASIGRSPLPANAFLPHQLVMDACYNPAKTQFLIDAENAGCDIMNGLGMSLYQGAAQIELWTGKKPPVDDMRRELEDIIAGKAEP